MAVQREQAAGAVQGKAWAEGGERRRRTLGVAAVQQQPGAPLGSRLGGQAAGLQQGAAGRVVATGEGPEVHGREAVGRQLRGTSTPG